MKKGKVHKQEKKLNPQERQQEIIKLLKNKSEVKFSELSKIFRVTEMTVRRDIEKLEEKKLLYRTVGGAILSPIKQLDLRDRMKLMMDEKIHIGKVAASLIKPNEAIFIDSGTTTIQISRQLKYKEITVITNAPKIALELQELRIPTILLGGQLEGSTLSVVGPIAETNLKDMKFHRAFIAASGVSSNNGLSNANYFELQIKKLVIERSQEVNVVIDSSKFESDSLVSFAKFDKIDRIITDRPLPQKLLNTCEKYNVEIIIASESNVYS
ncbi:MAG: DeoR/GlpR family DNA-binding transcription regulator [Solibacillus sp.]